MITIVIVDDCDEHISLLKKYTEQKTGIELLYIATSGLQAAAYCHSTTVLPDVMIVDYEMKPVDGLQLTRYLNIHFPEVKVLALSSHDHLYAIENMFACGAMGYLTKAFLSRFIKASSFFEAYLQQFYIAIETVASKGFYLDMHISQSSTTVFSFDTHNPIALKEKQTKYIESWLHQLHISRLEYQALYLYCSGLSIAEIATMLIKSPHTIKNHIEHIAQKFKARDRRELVLEVYRHKMVPSASLV